MRVLIVTVGSRGDVAPFTGLGTALQAAGHSVTIAGYEMFAGLVTGCGLQFRSLPGDPRMLEAARWGRGGTGPLGAIKLIRLAADHLHDVNQGILAAARQGTDVLLLQGISAFGGYHIAEALALPSIALGLQPLNPTREFPPSTVTARSLGRWGNRAAANAGIIVSAATLGRPVKELRAELGLPPMGGRQAIFGAADAANWPGMYGFSPSVVPRPADWRSGLEVVGYWWPARPPGWQPPGDLADFLSAGPPPVFIGMGSMNPADAARVSDLAAAAGRQAGVRMVIQAGQPGSDGAAPVGGAPGETISIGDVPHDWLFPQMAAVIHHAGAGTTGAGLRAGIPAVSLPMIGDQPFWAARLTALGVAPRPIPYKRLSAPALTAAIRAVITDPSYRKRAQDLAARLAREDGAAAVVDAVKRLAQ